MSLQSADENYQRRVQRTSEEIFDELNFLKSSKEFLDFSNNLIETLNEKKTVKRDSLSHKQLKKKYFNLQTSFLSFHVLKLFQSQKFFFHPIEYRNFYENELEEIKKNISGDLYLELFLFINLEKKSKFIFENYLKNFLDEKIQKCFEHCEFEKSITSENKNYIECFAKNYTLIEYAILTWYFLNLFECMSKLKGLLNTIKTLIYQNEEDAEFITYDVSLLKLFYKNILSVEHMLTMGAIENVNLDICIDYIKNNLI